jgi:hypothetical protein
LLTALWFPPSAEWPGVQLGTLCEDWSPSSADSDVNEDPANKEPAKPHVEDKSGELTFALLKN